MPLAKFVSRIKEHIQRIAVIYNTNINNKRIQAPRLLDRRAFAKIKYLLTWYSFDKLYHLLFLVIFSLMYIFAKLLAKRWEATKQINDAIEANKKEEIYFNINDCNFQCLLKCELPL